MRYKGIGIGLALAATWTALPVVAQVEVGRFDYGKMWTFEYPPAEYFTETYGFDATSEWFERARLSALRIPGCSASFVSPSGLLVTNHHCVRGAIASVNRPGEMLVDTGFYASSLEQERRIPRFYADQLVAVDDVTDEVFAALDQADTDAARTEARQQSFGRIQTRLAERHAALGGQVRVQIIGLYNGGRYSAYVFRRFTDVRLVFAVELKMQHFGGDPDNFTYPRYALDFAFLRVYGEDGDPLETDHYFELSLEGVQEGDVVFVIGNPGATRRLNTVAQLEFQRDLSVPARVQYYTTRLAALREFYTANPDASEAVNVRNSALSVSNSLKAYSGRLAALKDPAILARKRAAEHELQAEIAHHPELSTRYGDLLAQIAQIQDGRRELAAPAAAFDQLGRAGRESSLLLRALAAYSYLSARNGAARLDTVAALRSRLLEIGDLPSALDALLLEERLADFERALGGDHPLTHVALGGKNARDAAADLRAGSVLASSASTQRAVSEGTLTSSDPAMTLVAALIPVYSEFRRQDAPLTARERQLASELGRARFAVYGRDVPPDGSSSPRITDGVVRGYEYNGTKAPPYTTFFGVYDRFSSHGPGTDWDLANRWLTPPPGFDLRTPLNFVSTADTYGGNSGSPAVTPGLALVGLNFDRNIEGLSRDFIYLPERGRNIMVDVRAIRASLDHVYDAHRIVMEFETGQLYRTEAEADAARR
jgi:hypothetical protein